MVPTGVKTYTAQVKLGPVLNILPWVRNGETRHRSREKNQKEFYSFVTHSSIERTQHTTQGNPGEAPGWSLARRKEGNYEQVLFIVFSAGTGEAG